MYLALKYLLGQYFYVYFYVCYWRRDHHFTWSSEPREGPAACRAKEVPSFLSYFKTLSIGRARESNPRPPALQSSALLTELILPRLMSVFVPDI